MNDKKPSTSDTFHALKTKEEELEKTKETLNFFIQHRDKLKERLTTALNALKSQTSDMELYKTMLETSMNRAKEAKLYLKEEKQKCQQLENLLAEKNQRFENVKKELNETKRSLKKEIIIHDELEQQYKMSNQTIIKYKQKLSEMELEYRSQVLSSGIINGALQENLIDSHKKQLLETEKELSNRLDEVKSLQKTCDQMQAQVKLLTQQLDEAKEKVQRKDVNLTEMETAVLQFKVDLKEKTKSEIELKKVVSETKTKLLQMESKYKCDIQSKQDEVSNLKSCVQSLRQLKELNSNGITPSQKLCHSIGTQYELQDCAVGNLIHSEKVMEISDKQVIKQNSETKSVQLDDLQKQVWMLQNENSRLHHVIAQDRNTIYYKNLGLSKANHDRRCFEWERQQYEKTIWHMKNEINDLKQHKSSTSQKSNYNCTDDSHLSKNYPCHGDPSVREKTNSGHQLEPISEAEESSSSSTSFPATPTSDQTSRLGFSSEVLNQSVTDSKTLSNSSSETFSKSTSISTCRYGEDLSSKTNPENLNHFSNLLKADSEAESIAGSDDVFYTQHKPSTMKRTLQQPLNFCRHSIQSEIVESDSGTHGDDGYSSYGNSADEWSTIGKRHLIEPKNPESKKKAPKRCLVVYNGVRFDLATLTLPKVRNIVSSCGSIATSQGMNDFYEFLAAKVDELNKDPYWKSRHSLGKASDWLSVKIHG